MLLSTLFFILSMHVLLEAQPILDPEILAMTKEAISAEEQNQLQSIINTLVGFGTRSTVSTQTNATFGIGAAFKWIKATMDNSKAINPKIITELDTWTQTVGSVQNVSLTNVYATIPGSDPNDNRIFLVSGHYDSRPTNNYDGTSLAPGADDDGSGTAVVLEALRILASYDFPATIMFATFTAEEQGLYGSQHLAETFVAQKKNLVAVLNNDIVGGQNVSSETNLTDYTHLRVFSTFGPSGSENDSPQRELARYVKETAEDYIKIGANQDWNVVLIYRADRYSRGGDQNSFNNAGFTAVRLCEINENFYHQHQDVRVVNGTQYGDLAEFMVWPYLAKSLATNIVNLAALARAPGVPTSVSLNTSGLSNLSTLNWRAPLAGASRVAGYNILIRETYTSAWQVVATTGPTATTATIPYSKDNYLFAVQSFDASGHKSVPVFA